MAKKKKKKSKRKQTAKQAAASAKNLKKARKAKSKKTKRKKRASPVDVVTRAPTTKKRKRKKGARRPRGQGPAARAAAQATLDFMNQEISHHEAREAKKAWDKYYSQYDDPPPGKPTQLGLAFGNPRRRRRRTSRNPIWLPKTARGRPARTSYWLLDVYTGDKIKTYVAKTDKRNAERDAMAKLVRLRADRVALSGPYKTFPYQQTKRR